MSKMFVMLIMLLKNIINFKIITALFLLCSCISAPAEDIPFYRGLNFSGLEIGDNKGDLIRYAAPSKHHYNYWFSGHKKNMNAVRLPFVWERLQPKFYSALNKRYLATLKKQADLAKEHDAMLILDMHNMARYQINGKYFDIGTKEVPDSAYYDAWIRLASHFKNHNHVMFGLMNEPMYGHTAQRWSDITQKLILELRKNNIKNTLIVSGVAFSGGNSWISSGNAEAFQNIHDPDNNMMIEIHQYFDYFFDGHRNGTKDPDLKYLKDSAKYLTDVTEWAKTHKHRLLLTETGIALTNAHLGHNLSEIRKVLSYIEKNDDVWKGYFFWGGGEAWPDHYPMKLSPSFDANGTITKEQIEGTWYKKLVARKR